MFVIANSRKHGGRCLAGVSLEDGRLVRPVSTHSGGALSGTECGVGGRTPRLLEIVSFEHCGSAGDPAQPENVVIESSPWRLEGSEDPATAREVLSNIAVEGPAIFGNCGRAVHEDVAIEGMDSSLAIVEPEELRFGHGPTAGAHAAGKPRVVFDFCGQELNFALTDFEIRGKLLQLPGGVYRWEDLGLLEPEHALLTVSLGALNDVWHQKLVAAVLRFY